MFNRLLIESATVEPRENAMIKRILRRINLKKKKRESGEDELHDRGTIQEDGCPED